MQIFRLHSFPIEQEPALERIERRLADLCAALPFPIRLLVLSQRFEMRAPIQAARHGQTDLEWLQRAAEPLLATIDAALAGEPDADPAATLRELPHAAHTVLHAHTTNDPQLHDALATLAEQPGEARRLWAAVGDGLDGRLWRLPWAKEMARFYQTLEHGHLRSATFILLAWPPADVRPDAVAALVRHATGRTVTPLDHIPSVLAGPYRERASHLRPEQPGMPWLAALLAYDARGSWDATTLHDLLNVPYDVALAIDIQTMTRNQAMRTAEMAYNAARVVARDAQIVDMRAQRVVGAAERVMHALSHESLHRIQIGVLVSGATEAELETHVAELRGRLGAQLRLMRPAGVQGEVLKLWSGVPRTQIEAPFKPRTVLSHGAGCCLGVLGYHRASRTDGIFWGLDAVRRAPLFFDLFRDNQAAHMVILGKTGFGKSFFLNLLALRAGALGHARVIGIDAFENSDRIQVAARAGARVERLGLNTPINILDPVYLDADGDGRPDQIQHAVSQVALLLGTPGTSADGKETFVPRALTTGESGVLGRALEALYADVTSDTPRDALPLLSDLIVELETSSVSEARSLARDLRLLLFGTDDPHDPTLTTLGQSFNAPTGVDWRFTHDITYLDLRDVPTRLRPFYYVQVIAAVLRFMRDPRRDRSRKTLLQIDEFGYLTQVEALARLAATVCKVARKYGIGLIAVDQNPITFLNSEHGRAIIEGAAAKVLFHLDDLPARDVGNAISDLTPAHVEFLSHAGVGEALAVVGNDVYVLAVEANPKELRALRGS